MAKAQPKEDSALAELQAELKALRAFCIALANKCSMNEISELDERGKSVVTPNEQWIERKKARELERLKRK